MQAVGNALVNARCMTLPGVLLSDVSDIHAARPLFRTIRNFVIWELCSIRYLLHIASQYCTSSYSQSRALAWEVVLHTEHRAQQAGTAMTRRSLLRLATTSGHRASHSYNNDKYTGCPPLQPGCSGCSTAMAAVQVSRSTVERER